MNMPKLRFKADDGSDFSDWNSMRFSDVFDEISNNTLARAKLSNETGQAKNIHYGDILTIFGNILDLQRDAVPFIIYEVDCSRMMPLQDGDIVIADTAEDNTVGKAVEVYNLGSNALYAGLHTIARRPKFKFASKYLGYYINSDAYHDQLIPYMQGTKQPAINRGHILLTHVSVPSLQEQRKIAECLDAVDIVINKQQSEIVSWEQYKKGVAQKLFSQEVRFKADDGSDYPDWQNVNLNELGRLTSGNGFNLKYQGHTDKQIYFYKVSDMNLPQNYKEMVTAQNTVDDDILKLMKIKPITSPSIIFAKVGMAIHAERKRTVNKPFCMDNNMMAFTPKSDVNFNFCYWLTQTLTFAKHAQPGSPPSLTATIIGNLPVSIPSSIEEQRKIAECLDAINDVIALSKAELEKWRELKQGLLQQLFV